MALLQIDKFSLSRHDRVLFKDLALTHGSGEVALWFGPSGCGKSSLAKAITGQVVSWTGALEFLGAQVHGYSIDRLYVGHDNDLFLWQTVRQHFHFLNENTDLNISDSDLRRFAEVLEVETLLGRFPKNLSMGETRRIQILRSLLLNSKFVVFDETFSALDVQLKKRILPKLLQIWKHQQTSVVIISHESEKDFNIPLDRTIDFSVIGRNSVRT